MFLHGAYGLRWDSFLDALGARLHGLRAGTPRHHPPAIPTQSTPLDDLWDLVLYYYELFDQLGLEAPVVVGHSFGGMVAAEVAATNPGQGGRLVLLSPLGLWLDEAPVKNWMSMAPEPMARAVFYDPEGPIAKDLAGVAEMTRRRGWKRRSWRFGPLAAPASSSGPFRTRA